MLRWTRRQLVRYGLRSRLGLLAGSATALVIAASAYLSVRYFSARLLALVQEASVLDSEELRGVLETQMSTGDRTAVMRLVADIGRGPGVAWVSVLDETGNIRISSDPGSVGGRFSEASLEMERLRRAPVDGRVRSETLLRDGCSVLRTLTPMPNREACGKCHGSEHPLLGALIIDRSLTPLARTIASSGSHVALGGAATLLVLLLTLGIAVERTVLQRLARLGEATRRLGRGDFAARARDGGADEIGRLAKDFNAMATQLETAVTSCAAERRQLGELVDGISDGVVLLDDGLRVVKLNRAFRARLPAEAVVPPRMPYRALVEMVGLAAPAEPLPAERAVASGLLEKQAVHVMRADGERFEELCAQPLRDADDVTAAVIEVWRDITDRKALEAGLEESERLASLGLLASSVAHEVGNPLASIVTAVDGLLKRLAKTAGPEADETREYLEIVRRQVFRCRSVTERLLGFARAPSSEVGAVDAAAAAREVLALVAAQARAQRVEVRADLGHEVLARAADLHLQQIFLNLVLNALQAMPRGGVLSVSAREEDGAALVTFEDSGPGIPPALRRHLFQPLRRARADGAGTGLGLFISHTLAVRCGGAILVESEPEKGARFTVRLGAARRGARGAGRDPGVEARVS